MSRARVALLIASAVTLVVAVVALAVRPSPRAAGRGGAPTAVPSQSSLSFSLPLKVGSWAYQLQGYPDGRLDQLAAGPFQIVVVDLARDAGSDWFSAAEIARVRATGKRVLAYFEIGSIEDFRPEYPLLRRQAGDLIANEWAEWPGNISSATGISAGGTGWCGRGWTGRCGPVSTGSTWTLRWPTSSWRSPPRKGVIATSWRGRWPTWWNTSAGTQKPSARIPDRPAELPELRHQPGYTAAVDGIGMEELFFEATDERCTEDYCAENLAETRALRDDGKFVLSVDYATRPADVRAACAHYRAEHFTGTVTVVDLDRTAPPCT